jgi:hypothetical protein
MGKFKVGDRVKVSYGHGWDGLGVVERVSDDVKNIIVTMESGSFAGDTGGFNAKHLELVPAAWQPKVGERVIATADPDDPGTITGFNGLKYSVHWDSQLTASNLYIWSIAELSPLPVAPPALTIEAGKFYRTRDGAKVGPMKQDDGFLLADGWHYGTDGHCGYKGGDTLMFADRDLIAEWVDETAVAVAASNDNAATLGDILQAAIGKTVTVQVKKPAFKVGDTVRFKQSYGLPRVRGKEAKVINVSDWGIQIDMNGETSTERPESIELVPVPSNPAIVALIESGVPKPSDRPFVHADEGAASKEASRLANKHKGKQFGVYVLTQTVSVEQTISYAHEWQRLAAKGEKINAIKALRSLTGLGLKATKDAVEHWVANDEPYARIAA